MIKTLLRIYQSLSTNIKYLEAGQIFIRAIMLSYYLGKPSSPGISVIYAQFSINGKQNRVSTCLRVQKKHWCQRSHYAIVAVGMTPLDIHNNILINQHLQKIDIAFFQKIEYFCCHYLDIKEMPEVLLSVIKLHRRMTIRKKTDTETKRSVTDLMFEYRLNHSKDNKERSYRTARTNILDFRKFLDESKIPDEITSMTKGIAASYAEWLKKKDITVNTANQRIRALATNLRNLTIIVELDFSYPLPEKLPLLEKNLTGDEMEEAILH